MDSDSVVLTSSLRSMFRTDMRMACDYRSMSTHMWTGPRSILDSINYRFHNIMCNATYNNPQ